jgi:mono/diheme cytochrome c family protein
LRWIKNPARFRSHDGCKIGNERSDGVRTKIGVGLAVSLVLLSACAGSAYPPASQCPQPRFTGKAPEAIYKLSNPLAGNADEIASGRRFYEKDAKPACQVCHGIKGDGQGPLAAQFDPPPRNFACAQTVNGIPDGQLFWIIRNGSPGTSMPSFHALRDEQVWQLVSYLRALAR